MCTPISDKNTSLLTNIDKLANAAASTGGSLITENVGAKMSQQMFLNDESQISCMPDFNGRCRPLNRSES